MTQDSNASRRSFLKGGAVLAVPLTAVVPTSLLARDAREEQLALLEDERDIRALRDAWLRYVNEGAMGDAMAMVQSPKVCRLSDGICAIRSDPMAEAGALTVAEDRKSAVQMIHCRVTTQAELAKDCTLALMHHAQGTGSISREEQQDLHLSFVRSDKGWSISRAVLVSV